MKSFILQSSLLVAAVTGSPLGRRQASSAASTLMMPSSAAPTDSMAMSTTAMGTMMPPMSSGMASSMASSMMSSMPMSVSSSGSTAGNSTDATSLYPCPEGYLLTYVNTQQSYNASLADVLAIGGDFQNATWMYYLSGTGGNDVGATRYLATQGGAKTEVLSQYFTNEENVAVQLVMNLTSGPLMAPNGVVLSNYSTTFQIYSNTSASTEGNNVTTAKLFCNFCADNQMMGMQAVLNNFDMALSNIGTLLMGGTVMYPGPNANTEASTMSMSMGSSMASTMMPAASMSSGADTMPSASMQSEAMSSMMPTSSMMPASSMMMPASSSSA